MAGVIPGFPADAVRDGIHLAMQLGLPVDEADRPTFYFSDVLVKDAQTDGQGTPLAWDAEREVQTPASAPKKVPCAITDQDGNPVQTGFGYVAADRLILTFLDVDYEQIKGFSHVVIGGNAYRYIKTMPPMGLDVVGVWQVHVLTVDEA